MKILALEFSSDQRSVAVLSAPEFRLQAVPQPPESGTLAVLSFAAEIGTRAVKALALIESALREATVAREEIECIAIGVGPGSYAGIRVALALAQGWQLARNVNLLGVSSADCLAAGAWESGLRGRIHVAIDAQRNEVYLADYQLSGTEWREVVPLRLAPMTELRGLGAAGEIVIGPEVNRWCDSGRVVFPQAKQVGLLAAGRTDFVPGEKLEPIYLRAVNFVKAPPTRVIAESRLQKAD